jgi:hypothetical protein
VFKGVLSFKSSVSIVVVEFIKFKKKKVTQIKDTNIIIVIIETHYLHSYYIDIRVIVTFIKPSLAPS